LTALVGELVGARLILHSGSLMNLAKQPASMVQILGAVKALFRALKTRQNTPKYGLIFHASLVGQAENRLKGKMARCSQIVRIEQKLERSAVGAALGSNRGSGFKKYEFVTSKN